MKMIAFLTKVFSHTGTRRDGDTEKGNGQRGVSLAETRREECVMKDLRVTSRNAAGVRAKCARVAKGRGEMKETTGSNGTTGTAATGRTAGRRPAVRSAAAWTRWVAVAAVAAGERVEGAREGETRLQAGVA